MPDSGKSKLETPLAAVSGVVLFDGRILMIRRGHAPAKGEWCFPGGKIQLGETAEDALRREMFEETGLLVEPVNLMQVFDRIQKNGKQVDYHYLILCYSCRLIGGKLQPGSDAADARWISHEESRGMKLTKGIHEVIEMAYKHFPIQ